MWRGTGRRAEVEAELRAVGGDRPRLVEHAIEPDVCDGRAVLAHAQPHEVIDCAGRAIEADCTRIEQAAPTPALLVPARAVQSISGTQRVFIAKGDRAEERIVTTGQTVELMLRDAQGRELASGNRS